MEELKEILYSILKIANSSLSNDEKHKLLSELWTRYYKLSNKLDIQLDEEYNISLMLEQESFIIKQNFIKKQINYDLLNESITKIKNGCGISEEEVINILNWTVENTKTNLSTVLKQLGKDVESDSLSSFCEVSQAITLKPLENIGINVTKNKASKCFKYPYNHAFGTATFNVLENNNIVKKTYLIDVTYRQFFTTVKCNEGMYYKKNSIAPDPGYFADETFARKLLSDGYIELSEKNAILYGFPFYKASLSLNDKENTIDFYNNIINMSEDYSANQTDLEGFNLELPNYKSRN